jgi:osmotically-inducible protein OsmY
MKKLFSGMFVALRTSKVQAARPLHRRPRSRHSQESAMHRTESFPIDDDRRAHRGKGPRGWRPDDARLLDDVCRRLHEDPWVDASELEVGVEDGVVSLRGAVKSLVERRRSEDLAWEVRGVVDVVNELRAPRVLHGEAHLGPTVVDDQGPVR